MYENLFLLILALIWLFVASISDLRKREVPNWLSFSLIIFALAYRVFFAVFNSDLWFFLYGLIGLILFIILAYGFYYARVFAGGDAKLLMGLGAILPFASSLIGNLIFLGVFILLFLFVGGIYGLIYSLVLVSGNKTATGKISRCILGKTSISSAAFLYRSYSRNLRISSTRGLICSAILKTPAASFLFFCTTWFIFFIGSSFFVVGWLI